MVTIFLFTFSSYSSFGLRFLSQYYFQKQKSLMNEKSPEQSKEVILTSLGKHSIQIPNPKKLREALKNRYHLPPIQSKTQCRRIRTEPDEKGSIDYYQMRIRQRELTQLKSAFSMSGSDILSSLSKKIDSLQSLHIISGGTVRAVRYQGHIKIPTVHNDYHNSKTNAGYSRNKYGGIYPK